MNFFRQIIVAWLALLPLAALSDSTTGLPATVDSDGGTFRLAIKPSRSPVPFNELFELQVDVSLLRKLDDPNPLWLSLDATMPGHGHGMNTHVRVDGPDKGRFIIRGLLLHMSGEWELSFDVAKGPTHEKAKARFVLE